MSYSTQFISNIESKNHQTFSLGTLWRLALVLNIDIKELFEENEITVDVINARFLKPLDTKTIIESINKTKKRMIPFIMHKIKK